MKQELLKPYPEKLKHLEDAPQKVYLGALRYVRCSCQFHSPHDHLVPATLRPETMYGQTNCWVLPTGNYGAFQVNENEIYVCSARSARNLSFQVRTILHPLFSLLMAKERSLKEGEVKCVAEFTGQDLIGSKIRVR